MTLTGSDWRGSAQLEWATEGNICTLRSLPHRELQLTSNVHWICATEAAKEGRAETCDFFAKYVADRSIGTNPMKQQTAFESCLENDPNLFHYSLSDMIKRTCHYISEGGNMSTCLHNDQITLTMDFLLKKYHPSDLIRSPKRCELLK